MKTSRTKIDVYAGTLFMEFGDIVVHFNILVGLGSSSPMDSFASWKMNGSGMEKEEREEMPLQGEDESRRNSPP